MVSFSAVELSNFEVEKNQLFKVSFGGCDVENLIIKNSSLKEIRFNHL